MQGPRRRERLARCTSTAPRACPRHARPASRASARRSRSRATFARGRAIATRTRGRTRAGKQRRGVSPAICGSVNATGPAVNAMSGGMDRHTRSRHVASSLCQLHEVMTLASATSAQPVQVGRLAGALGHNHFLCIQANLGSTWSAVLNLTSRAGGLSSAPSGPDDRYRVTG